MSAVNATGLVVLSILIGVVPVMILVKRVSIPIERLDTTAYQRWPLLVSFTDRAGNHNFRNEHGRVHRIHGGELVLTSEHACFFYSHTSPRSIAIIMGRATWENGRMRVQGRLDPSSVLGWLFIPTWAAALLILMALFGNQRIPEHPGLVFAAVIAGSLGLAVVIVAVNVGLEVLSFRQSYHHAKSVIWQHSH